MAKLKTIHCHYCKKLLWSARWTPAKRKQYDREPSHRCPELADYMRHIELRSMKEWLTCAQAKLSAVLKTVTVMAEESKTPTKPARRTKR